MTLLELFEQYDTLATSVYVTDNASKACADLRAQLVAALAAGTDWAIWENKGPAPSRYEHKPPTYPHEVIFKKGSFVMHFPEEVRAVFTDPAALPAEVEGEFLVPGVDLPPLPDSEWKLYATGNRTSAKGYTPQDMHLYAARYGQAVKDATTIAAQPAAAEAVPEELLDMATKAVEAYEDRFESIKGHFNGPIDTEMRELAAILESLAAPAQPAPEPAAEPQNIAALIVRSVCESDPADPEHADTVCVNVNDLAAMIVTHLPAATVPEGWTLVPVEFIRGFGTLAHNYSLTADAPDYYQGTERDAFRAAYARCGQSLALLRPMLEWKPPKPAADAGEVERDAARYRCIRNAPYSDHHGDLYAMSFQGDGDVVLKGAELDAAADAAIESIDRRAGS